MVTGSRGKLQNFGFMLHVRGCPPGWSSCQGPHCRVIPECTPTARNHGNVTHAHGQRLVLERDHSVGPSVKSCQVSHISGLARGVKAVEVTQLICLLSVFSPASGPTV